jgi:hypothetical protein
MRLPERCLFIALFIGCGATPPSPSIRTLAAYYGGASPLNSGYAIAGQGSFMLLVNGTGFTESSMVEWNGAPLPTHFGDGTDLTASVPRTLIASAGKAVITVKSAGGGSNTAAFVWLHRPSALLDVMLRFSQMRPISFQGPVADCRKSTSVTPAPERPPIARPGQSG